MPGTTSSTPRRARKPGRVHLGWVFGVLVASIAAVTCLVVALAWFLGGRAAPNATSVQELLPPEPRQNTDSETAEDAAMLSAVQPSGENGGAERFDGGVAAVLPGAIQGAEIKELPVENLSDLKSLGWAVPYLSRNGYEHEYIETGSLEGIRTIQVHMADGEYFINVAETRVEEDGVELQPLEEKLHNVIDLQHVDAEELELSTGQQAVLYSAEDARVWTTAVETGHAQYVITSSQPVETAPEVTSWVMVTDRSRVQLMPSSPGPADRLERGFDEMRSWFSD